MLIGNKRKSVAIKTLVEFAAKSGSLDHRFTPSPTGQEGIEGHKQVTARRHSRYQPEVSLTLLHQDLLLKGRADGYDPDAHCIEEIKTFYGDINAIPDNHRELHWAQAKCYGWMMCEEKNTDRINIALIYFNLTDEKEYRFQNEYQKSELTEYCEGIVDQYRQWQTLNEIRLNALHVWIEKLAFPMEKMYPSQRVMAEAVYKAAAMQRVVLAEAPTGTGKTLASLFPALKSLTRTPVDKIFYLTAKTTAKQLAIDTMKLIATDRESLGSASPLRTLELTAQEKACLEPEKECNGDSCQYAFSFYEKLKKARIDASQKSFLDKETLNEIALRYQLCPFYLSMEMVRWVDVVIADVNYYFDGSPLLLALTQEFNWNPYLLVDESHNLIDRARQMYSAELNRGDLLIAKKISPDSMKKILTRINNYWLEMIKEIPDHNRDYYSFTRLPEKFLLSLQDFVNSYITLLQKQPDNPIKHSLVRDFFFAAVNFQKIADILDDDFCIDMQSKKSKSEVLTIRNLIPAKPLASRINHAQSAAFFSATLNPTEYYQQLLGLPQDTVSIKVPSPFRANQLKVQIANRISTRYKDRQASIPAICNIIEDQLKQEPGNALAFFSSYEFLEQVESGLRKQLDSNTQLLIQSKGMSEQDREDFIAQFSQHQNILGLVVLGGVFSEGIDLPGNQLKGAFIATLGLPQINPVNENLSRVMQDKFQQGYHFTYTYPGVQKVIQAAGRVIRTKDDQGYLWLLDDRYQDAFIQSLLPEWWNTQG